MYCSTKITLSYIYILKPERFWYGISFQRNSHIWIFLAACWESAKLTRIKTDSLHSLFGSRRNLSMSFCDGANMSAYAWLQWVYLSIYLVHSGKIRIMRNCGIQPSSITFHWQTEIFLFLDITLSKITVSETIVKFQFLLFFHNLKSINI